jgi:hypothetical protein
MTLIIELPPEKEAALRTQAQAAGMSAEELALQVLSRSLTADANGAEKAPVAPRETAGEMIRRIVGDPPPEELAKLPKDFASQVDHYLYGAPKE